MTKYESESIVEFWGGLDNCNSLVRSYQNATDDQKIKIEENYKISMIIEALSFNEVNNEPCN